MEVVYLTISLSNTGVVIMLILFSSLLVVAYTIYYCFFIAPKKQFVSAAIGKCISMALGMVSSTMIGILVAFLLPGELAYSTVLSIFISAVFACFVGVFFGITGIIESLSASFMGAMMGAMLGDMTPDDRQVFILIAMDIIYVFSVLSLMFLVNRHEIKETKSKGTRVKSLVFSLVASLSIIGVVAAIESSNEDTNETPHAEHVHEY
jgi:glucan phosphoethanolaminetransferase (alkaline phosphatase superfamily)